MMTTDTMKLIVRLKENRPTIWTVAKHMADIYSTDAEYYNLEDIERELRHAITDYFQTCEDPRQEMRRLMYWYEDKILFPSNIMVFGAFLRDTQVRSRERIYNDGKHPTWSHDETFFYINGFDRRVEQM